MSKSAKFIFAAFAGLLVGISTGPLFYKQLPPVHTPETLTATTTQIPSDNNVLVGLVTSLETMLIEQSMRLQATEQNLQNLLHVQQVLSMAPTENAPKTMDTPPLSVSNVEENADYHYVSTYIAEQLHQGTWSAENANHLIQETAALPHEHRAALQQQIVQAINRGDLTLDDPSVPIL